MPRSSPLAGLFALESPTGSAASPEFYTQESPRRARSRDRRGKSKSRDLADAIEAEAPATAPPHRERRKSRAHNASADAPRERRKSRHGGDLAAMAEAATDTSGERKPRERRKSRAHNDAAPRERRKSRHGRDLGADFRTPAVEALDGLKKATFDDDEPPAALLESLAGLSVSFTGAATTAKAAVRMRRKSMDALASASAALGGHGDLGGAGLKGSHANAAHGDHHHHRQRRASFSGHESRGELAQFHAAAADAGGGGAALSRKPVSSEAGGADGAAGDGGAAALAKMAALCRPPRAARSAMDDAFHRCWLLRNVSEKERETLQSAMREVPCVAGERLYAAGDAADEWYVVQSGAFAAKRADDGAVTTHMKPGASFGLEGLLYVCGRAEGVECTSEGTVWSLSRARLRAVLCSPAEAELRQMGDFLRTVSLFAGLAPPQLVALATAVSEVRFAAGEFVVQQGDRAAALYIIKSGQVVCRKKESRRGGGGKKDGGDLAVLGPGETFGESALADDERKRVRKADVVAFGDCVLVEVRASTFRELLGASLAGVAARNLELHRLREIVVDGVALHEILSASELRELLHSVETLEAVDGQFFECVPDTFYLITAGTASLVEKNAGGIRSMSNDGRVARVLGEGDYIGEAALLGARAAPVFESRSLVARGELSCLTMDWLTAKEALGPLGARAAAAREQKLIERSEGDAAPLSLSDLEVRGALVAGQFGRTLLVRLRDSNVAFALKQMKKGALLAASALPHALNERAVLQRCGAHPFLPRCAAACQDAAHLYLATDYCAGGTLGGLLRIHGAFDEKVSEFYVACAVCALEFLHERRIVSRGLSPDGILLGADGWPKLGDFGCAKELGGAPRTYTFCGVAEYLAPEIVLCRGHDTAVDWWALGVLLHELLVGATPFVAPTALEVYERIARERRPRLGASVSLYARELIGSLLVGDPAKRLASQPLAGAQSLKEHGFFGGVDWVALYAKRLPPPSKPVVAGPLDMSNYERCDDNFEGTTAVNGNAKDDAPADHPAFAEWSTRTGAAGDDGALAPMMGARRGSLLWKKATNVVHAAGAFRRASAGGLAEAAREMNLLSNTNKEVAAAATANLAAHLAKQ